MSKIRTIPSVTIENYGRLENNRQLAGYLYDGTYQSGNNLNTIALSNKVAYTKGIGNFVFMSGVKYRLYKKSNSMHLPEQCYLLRIPVVTLKYNFSPRSCMILGLQGFDGMEMKYTDYIREIHGYKQKNQIFEFENKSSYFGFVVWGSWGFRLEQVDHLDKKRKYENIKNTYLYVKVDLGYE